MLLFFITLYLLSNVAVGAWAARRVTTSQDFVLAGRRLPLMLAASVTFATWFGSETIMGAPAMFVEGGFLAVIEEPFGSALCLFMVGAFFARPLYRLNITTFSDYFRIRYGRAAELLSALLVIPSYFSWISAQLVAIGIVLSVVTDIPREYCIIASAAIVMIYTLLGGMWSISVTDFFHNLIIILALAVLGVLLWKEVGGWEVVAKRTPAGFFRFLPESTRKDWLAYIAAWITVGLGSIPQQDVFQRVMAARTERIAVRASFLASFMYVTIAMLPLFIALSAKLLHPDLPSDNQLIIPNMVMRHGGLPLQVLFFGAITSAILSVSSGAILAPATVFGENVIKFFKPDISDQALLKTIRWAVVVITIICVLISTTRDTNIFDLVGESSAFSLVSLFIPLAAGIYWKRANVAGCLCAMLIGLGVWFVCLWQKTEISPMLWGLLASTIAMIGGSLMGKEMPVETVKSR